MNNNYIEKQINFLKEHSNLLDDYLQFYKKILIIQNSAKLNINRDSLKLFSQSADLDQRLNNGLSELKVLQNYY